MSANAWILRTKLAAPAWPPDGLRRSLWDADSPLPPATVLLAGPGYGKTLAMASLLATHLPAAPALWLTLDELDTDLASFFHYMLAGMRAHIPQFGASLEAMLAGDRLEPKRLFQAFFQDLAGFNLPAFALVLDDAHHLAAEQGELLKALGFFLERLPPGVHVLIASRRKLALGLPRLVAKGAAVVFERDRLAFTAPEIAEFLKARAPATGVPEAWREQASSLDGWPLGLDLATRSPDGRSVGPVLADYVAEELLEAQPPERRAFMRRSAILQELTPEACAAVSGASDAADELAALEGEHLVQRLAGDAGYRFPTYLRECLLAEAEREDGREAVAAYQREAAAYYQARGQHELALPHLVAAGEWGPALEAGAACFPAMRYSGRQALITRWLAAFPAHVAGSEPLLPLWQGHVNARAGKHEEAAAAYDRAERLYAEREDAAGSFKVLVQQCNLALLREDMKRFGSLMLRALASQAEGADEDRVDLHLIRGRSAEQRGDLALMQECNEAVLAIAAGDNIEIAASHCIACLNLFTLAHHKGDLAAARRHVERAIAVASERQFHPYRLYASFLRAHVQLAEGDLAGASAFLGGLEADWPDLLDWLDQALAWIVVGHWHQAKDDWKAAEEALGRSLAIFERAGYREGKKVPLERLLYVAIQRRALGRVPGWLAEAGVTDPHWPSDEALSSIHDLALAVPYARVLHLQQAPERALAVLERVVPALEEQGARFHLARARLFEAASLAGVGDRERAIAVRDAALALTADYRFLLEQDRALWDELAGLEATVPATAAPTPAPEPAAAEKLALRFFGEFEARLGTMWVTDWPRKLSKGVLTALALYPRGLNLPDLAEILGAGTSPSSLKMAISALRKAFEPQLDARAPSRYVVLEGDRYMLAWDEVAACDVRAFEAAMREGDRCAEPEPLAAAAAYEEAVGHYQGQLWGEGFEAEREQLRGRAIAALTWLAGFHRSRGDFTNTEAALTKAAEVAPCDEDVALALMRHHAERGRPERVRPVYWDLRKALKARFGLAPSPEFEAAYKALAPM